MPWYFWYIVGGAIYYLLQNIDEVLLGRQKPSLHSSHEKVRQRMLKEAIEAGNIQVEIYQDGRTVEYPKTDWGKAQLDALRDLDRSANLLDSTGLTINLLTIGYGVLDVAVWPILLFKDIKYVVRRQIANHKIPRSKTGA